MRKQMAAIAVLAALALAFPVAAEEVCTTEDFPNIPHDQYLGVVGGLDFGNDFAGFDQQVWFNSTGNYLWPQCADGVAWMPAEGGISSTTEQLTRIIEFTDDCCVLTSIRIASHEATPGDFTIRALDSNMQQIGDAVTYEDLVITDGCVLIYTEWTECAAKLEVTYTRGSELGIIDMTYCCGEDEGGEGCTPGFWKANLKKNGGSEWSYDPNMDFDTFFGVDYFNPDITFAEAVNLGGGGVNALARHAVAAVLSANSGDVAYAYTVAEIIALVQAGGEVNKDLLDDANNAGCPLSNNGR
jgi:hypothetical protein